MQREDAVLLPHEPKRKKNSGVSLMLIGFHTYCSLLRKKGSQNVYKYADTFLLIFPQCALMIFTECKLDPMKMQTAQ